MEDRHLICEAPFLSESTTPYTKSKHNGAISQSKNGTTTASVRTSPRRRSAAVSLHSSVLLGLPWELQYKILQEVCAQNAAIVAQLATVCSSWRQLADDPSIWRCVAVPKGCRASFGDGTLERFIRKKLWAELQRLNLKGTRISASSLALLPCGCPHLSAMNLADCKGVTGPGLLAWLPTQTALRSLTLSRMECVQDTLVKALVVARPELESLSLKGCEKVGSAALRAIATGLCHLRVLDLTGAGSLRALITCSIQLLQSNCPALEVLRLSALGTGVGAWDPWVTLEEGKAASRVWVAKLRSLAEGDEETQLMADYLGPQGHTLTAATPATCAEAAKRGGFPKLRELRVAPAQLPSVGLGSRGAPTSNVTDSVLWQILKGSLDLRVLDITAVHTLSTDILHAIPAGDLEVLLMGGSQPLSGGGLEVAARRWGHSLTELDASHSTAVSDLTPIRDHCQLLRRLHVGYTAVDEGAIKAVLSSPHLEPLLDSIDTSACRSLSRNMRLPGTLAVSVLKGIVGVGSESSSGASVLEKEGGGATHTRRGRRHGARAGRPSSAAGPSAAAPLRGGRKRAASKQRGRKRARAFGADADSEDDSDYTPGKKEPEASYAWET